MIKRFSILFLMFIPVAVLGQLPQTDLNWQLLWEDNFNGFNNDLWLKTNDCKHGYEPQLFVKNNVWVNDGKLIIRVNNDKTRCLEDFEEYSSCQECDTSLLYEYTSGRVETMPAYAIRFGYVEARIKVPHYDGLWPAFWTLIKQGLHHEDPGHSVSEIDIFEIYAHKAHSNLFNHMETNLHHVYNPSTEPPTAYLQEHDLKNFNYTDWHKYAIEWDPVKIIWYVDDTPIRTTYNHGIMDSVRLIMNVAIVSDGQYWPETTPYFARHMLVDYVKVYGLKCDKHTIINEIPDFSAYDYKVKKSITLGSGTTIPAGTDISLRANDYIELLSGFEVPAGGQLYLDVSPCQ